MAGPSKSESGRRSLKIGEVARRTGLGIETLRYYERLGLLEPGARTESGYRLYGEEALEQLDFIRKSQTLGLSLGEIAAIVAERRTGGTPCATVRDLVRRRIVELDERLAELKRFRRELAATLASWEALGDVPGHVCGLIEGSVVPAASPKSRPFSRRRPTK